MNRDPLSEISDDLGLPHRVVAELSRRLDASDGLAGRVDVEGALARIGRVRPEPESRFTNKYVWRYLTIAVALIAVVLGIKYMPGDAPATSPQYTTYSTANGQRANIVLADGSRVTLAPATTLRIAGRNVELAGEAVFTVTQHTEDPFTVQAGGTTTRVLGTVFGVRSYDNQVRVAVSEGKVMVANATLSSGDAATVIGTVAKVRHNADVRTMLGWTSGRLLFNNTPLREAIPDLNRWYDIDIRVTDEALNSRALLGPMPAGSPAELAYTLGRVLDVRVERAGRVITLSPNT